MPAPQINLSKVGLSEVLLQPTVFLSLGTDLVAILLEACMWVSEVLLA